QLVVDVVEDDEVGAHVLDAHAAPRRVEAHAVDDEAAGGVQPVPAPASARAVVADAPFRVHRVVALDGLRLEQRRDVAHAVVGVLLGGSDVPDVTASAAQPGRRDGQLTAGRLAAAAWPDPDERVDALTPLNRPDPLP